METYSILIINFEIFVFIYVYVWDRSVCHMCANAVGGQERVLDPLEMELQVIVRLLSTDARTKSRSSAKAGSTFNL